ncbi:hypothetical protein D9M68_699690 [compost metagenome]
MAAVGRCNTSSNQNSLPCPGSLRRPTSPPIISVSLRTIDRPRPVPLKRRVEEVSAWVNGVNSRDCVSASMPVPVSRTVLRRRTWASSIATVSSVTHTLPACVNFSALPIRLMKICRTRRASPSSTRGTSCATVIR